MRIFQFAIELLEGTATQDEIESFHKGHFLVLRCSFFKVIDYVEKFMSGPTTEDLKDKFGTFNGGEKAFALSIIEELQKKVVGELKEKGIQLPLPDKGLNLRRYKALTDAEAAFLRELNTYVRLKGKEEFNRISLPNVYDSKKLCSFGKEGN